MSADLRKAEADVRRKLVERDRAGGALMTAQARAEAAVLELGKALARLEVLKERTQ